MESMLKKVNNLLSLFKRGESRAKDNKSYNCILGEGSKIYSQATIFNKSSSIGNILIGQRTHIAGNLTVWKNSGRIEIGDYCFVGENSRIYSAKYIKIGNRVQIAHNCNIFDNNIHSLNACRRHDEYIENITKGLNKIYDLNEKEVVICDDAWIGACVIILKGTVIGTGAVIGAGSVVTTDIPAFTIAVGNPARVIKKIDTDDNDANT